MDSQSNDQIVCKLTRALENYLVELESIVPVRDEGLTKYRLYLKESRDYELIRSLKRDIAASLGIKRIEVTIMQEYAEIAILN